MMDMTEEKLRELGPKTIIYALGGTRRRAILDGISINDQEYIQHTRHQIVANAAMFFEYKTQDIIVPSLGPRQLIEKTYDYNNKIINWIVEGLTSPEMIKDYEKYNCNVRFIGPNMTSELADASTYVYESTKEFGKSTIWFYFVKDDEDVWNEIINLAKVTEITTWDEMIFQMYGKQIFPATMYIGFGKLTVGSTLAPPLLTAPNMQCYWIQKAGARLTKEMLNHIMLDYAISRKTWKSDRSSRYEMIEKYRILWESEQIIGVGRKIGGFWYPGILLDNIESSGDILTDEV